MTSAATNPSPVIRLIHGNYSAQIATFGGGVKSLAFRGKPLVETYADGAYPPLSAGVILAPWPNRTEDGLFALDGDTHQLQINEPERNNAIHGFVAEREWDIADASSSSCTLSTSIASEDGWPWPMLLTSTYYLDDRGLHARFVAKTNRDSFVPFAFGWHTYLSAQGCPVDRTVLRVDVDAQLPLSADRLLPCGELEETDTAAQLARGLHMADVQLDDCFHRSAVGHHTVTLTDPDGHGVAMTCCEELAWQQIFTPDPATGTAYPGVGRTVAVEPMTAPPNALHTNTDIFDLSRFGDEGLQLNVSIAAVNGHN